MRGDPELDGLEVLVGEVDAGEDALEERSPGFTGAPVRP